MHWSTITVRLLMTKSIKCKSRLVEFIGQQISAFDCFGICAKRAFIQHLRICTESVGKSNKLIKVLYYRSNNIITPKEKFVNRYNNKYTKKGANNVKFCEKLKKIREEKGMTQVELANLTGLGQTTISNLEHLEHRKVSADTVVKIARALNVPVEQLMDG